MALRRPAIRHPDAVRAGLLVAGLAGVAALVAATLATIIQVGRLYTDATAGPELGFWLELAGGVSLVVAGLGLSLVNQPYQRSLGAGVAAGGIGRRARYQR